MKFVPITKDSPGATPFVDELNRQEILEAEARIDAQQLSREAGVQTDGNIYWLNGKNRKSLIEVEDFTGQNITDQTRETGRDISCFGSGMSENEIATTTERGTRVSLQAIPTNKAIEIPGSVVSLLNGEGNDTLYYGNMHGVQLGIDASKDNIYHTSTGLISRYYDNPSQELWNKITTLHEHSDKTHLFKNYQGESISMILGSDISSPRRAPLSIDV